MATWELHFNNANNAKTAIYVMEDDDSGLIITPEDLIYPGCFESETCCSSLMKRFYQNLAIGGTNFPPVCKEIAGGATGTLIISATTSAVKVWTYSNSIWTAKSSVTKKNISNGTTIAVPKL